jgi:hypothetical protein
MRVTASLAPLTRLAIEARDPINPFVPLFCERRTLCQGVPTALKKAARPDVRDHRRRGLTRP